jgi:hypothetical protein
MEEGALSPHDSQLLMQITNALLGHLEHLYWDLSRRDALEGQHLRLRMGNGCQLEVWLDEDRPVARLQWPASQRPKG